MTPVAMKALAERCRRYGAMSSSEPDHWRMATDAGRAIDALILALEEARNLLQPFAMMADEVELWRKGTNPIFPGSFDEGYLRAARDWLAKQVTR